MHKVRIGRACHSLARMEKDNEREQRNRPLGPWGSISRHTEVWVGMMTHKEIHGKKLKKNEIEMGKFKLLREPSSQKNSPLYCSKRMILYIQLPFCHPSLLCTVYQTHLNRNLKPIIQTEDDL